MSLSVAVGFETLSSWERGFEGRVTLVNRTGADAANWQLSFAYPGKFTWLSEAVAMQTAPGIWVWKPAAWNRVLPKGATMVIGFGGTKGTLNHFHFTVGKPEPAPAPAPSPGQATCDGSGLLESTALAGLPT